MKEGILAEPALVGRKLELEELDSFLNSALLGKGITVFVSGEAGSGKTRLIREFMSVVKKKGAGTMVGWCLSDAEAPYFPFTEAFNAYFSSIEDQLDSPGQLQASLNLEVPSPVSADDQHLTAWLSGVGPQIIGKAEVLSPQVWKDQVFANVAKTLHSISAQNPLVVFIEDIHWADSASLALLHYVARAVNNSERILVVATFRSEEVTNDAEGHPHPLAETMRLMRREDLFAEIKLCNLDQASVTGIAENMIGGYLRPRFAGKLMAESRGNPLFVVESVRMLHESGSLVQKDEQWDLEAEELRIPTKIKDIILRRLAVLNYSQRRVLDAASVIGEKFDAELLANVLGQSVLEVLENLNVIAQSTSIVFPEESYYRFDHARSREVLYEVLSVPLKRGYHAKVAERLEATRNNGNLPFADLAYHFDSADNKEKAVRYSLAAGQEELTRCANSEAIGHFKHAVETVDDKPGCLNDLSIALEGLGDAYNASDNFSQATSAFERLSDLQTGAVKLRALRKAIAASIYQGDVIKAFTLIPKAEEIASADPLEATMILFKKALLTMVQDWVMGTKMLEDALHFFEKEYALPDVAEVLIWTGYSHAAMGKLEDGAAEVFRSLALYNELGNFRGQMEAYAYASGVFHCCALMEDANRMASRVLEINEQYKIEDYVRMIPALVWLSIGLLATDLPNALSKAHKALEYCDKTDSNLYRGAVYETLIVEYAMIGDTNRVDEYFGKFMKLPEYVLSNPVTQSFIGAAIGVYYTAKGNFEQSNQTFNSALAVPHNPYEVYTRQLYAFALGKQGKFEDAKLQAEQSSKIIEANQSRFSHFNIQSSLMAFTHPQANQNFDLRLDVVNVSKNPGTIEKVENLLVSGLKIVNASPNCLVRDGIVEMRIKTIEPFEVKTIKLTLKATKPAQFQLNPTVVYVDDTGQTKTSNSQPLVITVFPPSKESQAAGLVKTGYADLDTLLCGGIPEGFALALTSPACDEKELLVIHFLTEGVERDETTFDVVTEAGRAWALAEKYPSSFRLFFCSSQVSVALQSLPNVVKLNGVENLTEFDVAIAKGFRTLDASAARPRRICLEVVSDVLLQHHANITRKWLSGLLASLKSKGFTTLAKIPGERTDSKQRKTRKIITNIYWVHCAIRYWAGELVCGFRTPNDLKGLRKLRPRVELQPL